MEEYKLDNPVWYALEEVHAPFILELDGGLRFYQEKHCRFGAYERAFYKADSLLNYAERCDFFYIVAKVLPELPDKIYLDREFPTDQMIYSSKDKIKINDSNIQPIITDVQHEELYNLIYTVMPGFATPLTLRFGKYFGIYKDGKLVAATGQRIQSNTFVEVSGVVTHPDHRGNGYASLLTAHVTNIIIDEGKLPILHVGSRNEGAKHVYTKLGYTFRTNISWFRIKNG
jgi:ribosomal protein S18 acetylase RimI-like enzyme